MTEREKMLAGHLYDANDPELRAARLKAHALCLAYTEISPEARFAHLQTLFGTIGQGAVIMPPFACDYGGNIQAGRNLFINYNCVILDCAPVIIGDDVQIAPAVQIYTATHPIDAATRRTGLELARPIQIQDGAWIGGGAILLPGITIGAGAVVGAGSVVTRDVPPHTVVAGNPARRLSAG